MNDNTRKANHTIEQATPTDPFLAGGATASTLEALPDLYIIRWESYNITRMGKGSCAWSMHVAQRIRDKANRDFPFITHWIEPVCEINPREDWEENK